MSAFLLSIAPSFLRNTTAGSFDGEALGVVAMMLSFHLWIRSCQTGSLISVLGAACSCNYGSKRQFQEVRSDTTHKSCEEEERERVEILKIKTRVL